MLFKWGGGEGGEISSFLTVECRKGSSFFMYGFLLPFTFNTVAMNILLVQVQLTTEILHTPSST